MALHFKFCLHHFEVSGNLNYKFERTLIMQSHRHETQRFMHCHAYSSRSRLMRVSRDAGSMSAVWVNTKRTTKRI